MSGSLIGGVIGAGIGLLVPGASMVTAAWGFSIGSTVGGILMPGHLPHADGPRLSDLRVQSSEYGRPIPIGYGTFGLQGNVIWSTDLVEVKTDTTTGGKGGPSQTTSNYTYFGNFAVAICDGKQGMQLLRVWAGPAKRLIYDGFTLEGGQIRFYPGTDDQMPDPLIEQHMGVDNTPAYRGTAYAVFEMFPLANDGNAIPFLTFEVSTGGKTCGDNFTEIGSARLYDPPPLYVSTHHGLKCYGRAAQDSTDNLIYYLRTQRSTLYLDKTDPINRSFVATVMVGPDAGGAVMALNSVERSVKIVSGTYVYTVDLNTFTVSTGTPDYPKADVVVSNGAYAFLNLQNHGTPDDWGRVGSVFGGYLIDCDGTVAAVSTTQPLTFGGAPVPAAGNHAYDVFDPVSRRLICFGDSCYYDFGTGTLVTTTTTFPDTVTNIVYNPYVRRIFCTNGADTLMINPEEITPASIPVECIIFGGAEMLYDSNPADVVNIHYSPLCVPLKTPSNYMAFIDTIPNSTTGGDVFLFKVGTAGAGMALMDIVSDLSDRGGMSSYDVSELTDIVDGYVIARQTGIRSAIDALRPAYFFDAVESQGIVRFVKRGSTTVTVIADEDLAARSDGEQPGDPLTTVRKQEVELPRTINVNYMLAATDYEQATKTAKRLVGFSLDETTLEMPIVLSDTKAQQIADVNLHVAWAGRLTYTFSLPRKYSQLEPTDLILAKGNLMRLTKVTATPAGVLKCEAISDDSSYYAPHVVVTETPPVVKTVFVPGATVLELM